MILNLLYYDSEYLRYCHKVPNVFVWLLIHSITLYISITPSQFFLHCLFGYYYFTDAFKEWHTNFEIHVSAFLTAAFVPAPMIDIVPFTSMYKLL